MAKIKLRYSPLFYEDLAAIIDYPMRELANEQAARKLLDEAEVAIQKRLHKHLGTAPYPSIIPRQYSYRGILVDGYLIFYVVIENDIVVRRIVYGLRDLGRIL